MTMTMAVAALALVMAVSAPHALLLVLLFVFVLLFVSVPVGTLPSRWVGRRARCSSSRSSRGRRRGSRVGARLGDRVHRSVHTHCGEDTARRAVAQRGARTGSSGGYGTTAARASGVHLIENTRNSTITVIAADA